MQRLGGVLLLLILAAALPLAAQRVDSTNTHFRIWAIDRVVTDEHGHRMPAHAKGKLAFIAIYSADDSMCVVEYVALKNGDLDDVRDDKEKDKNKDDKDKTKVRAFEKGRTKKSDFEAAAKAAGFVNLDLDKFFVRVP
jgi:hypothetical protein